MVNVYRKGNRSQQKAKRFYESLGYQVEVVRRDMWRKDQDFFGLWDLICVGPDVRFVQVKTNRTADKAWKYKASRWTCPSYSTTELVIYKDYQRGDAPSERLILTEQKGKA